MPTESEIIIPVYESEDSETVTESRPLTDFIAPFRLNTLQSFVAKTYYDGGAIVAKDINGNIMQHVIKAP